MSIFIYLLIQRMKFNNILINALIFTKAKIAIASIILSHSLLKKIVVIMVNITVNNAFYLIR